jgi:LysM repeat protein
VRRGETASQIARRYGVGLDALLDYNGLSRDSVIKAGKVLRIPSSRASKNQSE